jgi:hypothetical protein
MDITPFTDAGTDLLTNIGVVGAVVVTTFVAVKSFGFITAWVGKLFGSAKGRAGG